MSSNIEKVVKDFKADVEHIYKASTQMVKTVVGYTIYELQDMPPAGTPRDTLRAVNGWNVAPGPVGDFTDPGPQSIHPEPDPELEIRKLTGKEDEATIANGVHYIGSLEFGSSRQSPRNFVRIAIDRALSHLDFTVVYKAALRGRVDRGARLGK